MPRADFLAFFRERQNLLLAALTSSIGFIALVIGLATLRGLISPRGAMVFAAILSAVAAAWYARDFLQAQEKHDRVAILLSCAGWILAALSFLMRAGDANSRAAGFFLIGAALLLVASASLSLSHFLVGAKTSDDSDQIPSTRGAKNVGDALRNARDL